MQIDVMMTERLEADKALLSLTGIVHHVLSGREVPAKPIPQYSLELLQ